MSYLGPEADAEEGRHQKIGLVRTRRARGQQSTTWTYDDADMSLRQFVRMAVKRAARAGYETDIRTVRALDERLRKLGYKCYWCGGPFEQIDHVNPLSRGGRDRLRNVVPSCARCNSEKSDMAPSVWRKIVKARRSAA